MSRISIAESHAVDAGMSRAGSRAGSISTLWSSADVPLCLDPRARPSLDDFDIFPSRGSSLTASSSRLSTRSSRISVDFGRLSVDIPDEYSRRSDSSRVTPPRASASASSIGSSPSRAPSFGIATIDEDTAVTSSSPVSRHPYQPPSLGAQHRVLSSRFSDDTVDEPHIPHSSSQDTFGVGFSSPRKSSGLSSMAGNDMSRASSTQDADSSSQRQPQSLAASPSQLYRRAYRFFDKEYSVQPLTDSNAPQSSSYATCHDFGEAQRVQRPSLMVSDLSHEGSVPSCSRSQSSTTQASSSDSSSAFSTEDSALRLGTTGPPTVILDRFNANAAQGLPLDSSTATSKYLHTLSPYKGDALAIPSLPSLPSFDSTLTATRLNPQRDFQRRPSTADVYSRGSQPSPLTLTRPLLPPTLPTSSAPSPARYQMQSSTLMPAPSLHARAARASETLKSGNEWTTPGLLRGRVASTPKLRLDPNALFPSEQGMHLKDTASPAQVRPNNQAADRRPSTAQVDGRIPFFARRFRSRTLGESDRDQSSNMQTATVVASRDVFEATTFPLRPLVLSSLSTTRAIPLPTGRHPRHVSAASSDLPSPLYSIQPTPDSSICSASSPATTNSSLPVTPRTTTSFPRPKSRGNGVVGKNGVAGWASYLHSGLTLHLDGDQGQACQITMVYLAYDPFGRPEQLVEEEGAARVVTPKRPKSRGDKDQEAEQSGTIEFGPSDQMHIDACTFDLTRKSEGSALLKHLTVGQDTKADLLTRQAALSLGIGSHQVSGYERKGRLAWKLAYRVEGDNSHPERRRLVPLRFSCSATLLNPERAKKSRLVNLVKKQMVSSLASKAVDPVEPNRYAPALASPASSHHSSKQLASSAGVQRRQPSSPAGRYTGRTADAGGMAYHIPSRQASRTAMSAHSATSAESSFCSLPRTPGKPAARAESATERKQLQASPISAHFGRSQRQPHLSATSTEMGPVQADNSACKKLQQKASMVSIGASSKSSGSVQMAKPIIINGRKLIPISLPAGLARKNRIEPTLLQANVISDLANPAPRETLKGTSMHSSTSSTDRSFRRIAKQDPSPGKCLLSNQPRSDVAAGGSSRPPTASETIKLEYLARTAATLDSAPVLRHQKSFAGAILTPDSFADEERRERRQRSKTNDDGCRRPFTADAWGQSQYPTREQQLRAFSQQHRTRNEEWGAAAFGPFDDGIGGTKGEKVHTLPVPPRPSSRPRTAQTINAASEGASFQVPVRAA